MKCFIADGKEHLVYRNVLKMNNRKTPKMIRKQNTKLTSQQFQQTSHQFQQTTH